MSENGAVAVCQFLVLGLVAIAVFGWAISIGMQVLDFLLDLVLYKEDTMGLHNYAERGDGGDGLSKIFALNTGGFRVPQWVLNG
jgi:hypothetical protein